MEKNWNDVVEAKTKKASSHLSVSLDKGDWGRLIGLKHRMELELGMVLTITEVIKAILSAACVLDLTPRAEPPAPAPAPIPADDGCSRCMHAPSGASAKCDYCGRTLDACIQVEEMIALGEAKRLHDGPAKRTEQPVQAEKKQTSTRKRGK